MNLLTVPHRLVRPHVSTEMSIQLSNAAAFGSGRRESYCRSARMSLVSRTGFGAPRLAAINMALPSSAVVRIAFGKSWRSNGSNGWVRP